MASGRISLLIDSPLRDMLIAARSVPAEVRKQMNAHMKSAAEPIWFDEVRGRAATRLQQRALVDSARVGVTNRNILLRSGSLGKLSSGTPVKAISIPAEFGASPTKQITQRSKKGTRYTRKLGAAFINPTRGGKVFWPSAREAIPRLTSVAIQTATRTALDLLEGKK